jgi:phosphatidate cytidylyltransferase
MLLLGLVVITTLLPSFIFALVISVVVLLAAWEWCGLTGLTNNRSRFFYLMTIGVMLAALLLVLDIRPTTLALDQLRVSVILGLGVLFWVLSSTLLWSYPDNKSQWNEKSKIAIMGLFALIPVWLAIVQLKYLIPSGFLVISLVLLVAAADVGAYFAGTKFGRTKLAPALSPSKSWEGVWGGLALCLLVGIIMSWASNRYIEDLDAWQFAALIALALLTTYFSVVGDLLESMLKRNQELKDSGRILPGHGGLLDRVDGLIAAAPGFTLVVMFVYKGAS